MTYLIMKLIKGGRPIKWQKVCTLERIFPNNNFLYERYDLTKETKISVRHTRRSNSKYHWKGYRTKWKHIYNGTMEGFDAFVKDYYEKIWEKKRKEALKNESNSNLSKSEHKGTG